MQEMERADRRTIFGTQVLGRCIVPLSLCAALLVLAACGEEAAPADPAGEPSDDAAVERGSAGSGESAERADAPEGDGAPEDGADHESALLGRFADGEPWLADITEEAGIDFVHENGMSGEMYFVEAVGSGVALFDYDRDGDLDLYFVQGHPLAPPSEVAASDVAAYPGDQLYRNDTRFDAEGKAAGPLRFSKVTEESGIRAQGYGMGVAVADYDADGWEDLYVMNWGRNELWRNLGDGRFEEVAGAAGVADADWSIGATFFDYDHDGDLDLYLVNYVLFEYANHKACRDSMIGSLDYCGPSAYTPQADRLFQNRGDGSFEDVSVSTGIARVAGPGLGVSAADFDDDGYLDVYVTNDGAENYLWMNEEGRSFEEQALMAGAALNREGLPEASMGVVAEDFDDDRDIDLFMTHLADETNTLYRNDGDRRFADVTKASSLGASSLPLTGFGVGAFDLENDGDLDVYVANGAVQIIAAQVAAGIEPPLLQPDLLFLAEAEFGAYLQVPGDAFAGGREADMRIGRGLALGDLDNDGDHDVIVTNNHAAPRLLENRIGQDRPWVGIELRDAAGFEPAGAKIVLDLGERKITRRYSRDGSFASSKDPRAIFGLAGVYDASEADMPSRVDLEVVWPDGRSQMQTGLEIGRYHRILRSN